MSLVGSPRARAADPPRVTSSDVAKLWHDAASSDLAAAYRLLADNHPALVAELHDVDFKARIENACAVARDRAAKVDSYAGYAAMLNAFANAAKDGHIHAHPMLVPATFQWAGILLAKRSEHWVVVDEAADKSLALQGAELVSCDGKIENTWKQFTAAQSAGEPLSDAPPCTKTAAHQSAPPSELKGRLFLLTDNSCFSSCLILVDDFKRLGATQIGRATDANTHYQEVRDQLLPSGLVKFSTQQPST
jgi:hypothetical protein